jgi:hypothetical protein
MVDLEVADLEGGAEAKYEGGVEQSNLKDTLTYQILIMIAKMAITDCELAKWYTLLLVHLVLHSQIQGRKHE